MKLHESKLKFLSQNVDAIKCNFTYVDSAENSVAIQNYLVVKSNSSEVFVCERDEEFDFIRINEETKANWSGNRYNSQDSFELQEVSCVSSKRFIAPKALNNIYNRLTPLMNSSTFVQKIQITECR